MKSLLVILLLSIGLTTSASAQGVPVILMAKSEEQVDTTGCNIVKEITRVLYRELLDGRIRIWDSQSKDLAFSASTLQALEKSAGVSFVNQEQLFIYERWTPSRREVTTMTAGFYFVHKSERGAETVFGFVDYNDVQKLFANTKVNANASGSFSTTLETALKSKNFNYRLVQLGERTIQTPSEGQNQLQAFVGNRIFNESTLGYYPPDKNITYLVDIYSDDLDTLSYNGKRIARLLDEYFLRNKEVFFNMGGDRSTSHLSRSKIQVTKVEVNEIWRKVGTEILYEPKSVTIFVNDSALNEITVRNAGAFEFRFGETDIFGFIRTREFNYIITKINAETIERKDAFIYQKGLISEQWNQLNRYVREYE